MCKVTISTFQFMCLFPAEDRARKHLEQSRWSSGAQCPYCGNSKQITARKGKRSGFYYCGSCRQEFTVRTGTVMERSKIPLQKWLYAMYLVVTARKGISSLQLSKELGITQKSAWFMLHRIREACRADIEKLSGSIELDETYIGGREKNKHKNKRLEKADKQIVVGLRERQGKMKAMPMPDTAKATLHAVVRSNVRPGSTIFTDENPSYRGALRRHKTVNHSAKQYVNGMAHTNGIESVWAVLKRGYNGVYHNFSAKHLARYVDEFAFRLNEGSVENHSLDRMDALCKKAVGKRLTYKELVS